jgi:hypothetical protein
MVLRFTLDTYRRFRAPLVSARRKCSGSTDCSVMVWSKSRFSWSCFTKSAEECQERRKMAVLGGLCGCRPWAGVAGDVESGV